MKKKLPIWVWILMILGFLWNFSGIFQIAAILSGFHSGFSVEQLDYYTNRPVWIAIAFIIGAVGGAVGSLIFLFRLQQANIILLLSLIAYAILSIGDITNGAMEVFGKAQILGISALVVLVASLLLWIARTFNKQSSKIKNLHDAIAADKLH